MRTISPERLRRELDARPGMIPVSIQSGRRKAIWCDAAEHRFTEPVFMDFLAGLERNPGRYRMFQCDVHALNDLDLPGNCLEPAGFIFHMGRCGSTLLSRALARAPAQLVMSEAAAHNDIWQLLTHDWQAFDALEEDALNRVGKLIRLTGRRRFEQERRYVVKFTSWQTLLFSHLRRLFPNIPCVFLYREPAAVLASHERSRAAWVARKDTAFGAFCAGVPEGEVSALGEMQFIEHHLAHLLETVRNIDDAGLRLVNYRELTPDNFRRILSDCLDFDPDDAALEVMLAQFATHSKDITDSRAFVRSPDAVDDAKLPAPATPASRRLSELYRQLEERRWHP